MYITQTVSDGITYLQDGPSVLTGDRTLLQMTGPRRVGAQMTLYDNTNSRTVGTWKNAQPSNPAGGNVLTFDLSDGLRLPFGQRSGSYTLTITPYMVAPGMLNDWQTLNNVTLYYTVRLGHTLPDRSYACDTVIPVISGDNIEYYCPQPSLRVEQTGSGDSVIASKTWCSQPWDGYSRTLHITNADEYVRGTLDGGFDMVDEWYGRLWVQKEPRCVPFVKLSYISADGCLRNVYAEIEDRRVSAEAFGWNRYGMARNEPAQYVTNKRVDYSLIVRGVPQGCNFGDIALSDYIYIVSGVDSRYAVLNGLEITENLYKKIDYRIKVTLVW